ncbi:MAG: hypothetical protein IJ471_04480 [Eubacterium sp.]|nr:hypothetical protein [Eubacterium sp.]
MGLIANQMLLEAVHKIVHALKEKKEEKQSSKTNEHEAELDQTAKKTKTNRKK